MVIAMIIRRDRLEVRKTLVEGFIGMPPKLGSYASLMLLEGYKILIRNKSNPARPYIWRFKFAGDSLTLLFEPCSNLFPVQLLHR